MKPREWMAVGLIVALAAAPPNFAAAQTQQQIAPAPAYHPPTRLTLPPAIAEANRTRSVDYGKSFNRPDLGHSWGYSVPGVLTATIYLYNLGQPSVAAGVSNPLVLGEFEKAQGDIVASKKYEALTTLKGPTNCVVGTITFRCITEAATVTSSQQRIKTELLVTGFRNHYLKVRLDWLQGSPQGEAAAEHFMQALVSQVLR